MFRRLVASSSSLLRLLPRSCSTTLPLLQTHQPQQLQLQLQRSVTYGSIHDPVTRSDAPAAIKPPPRSTIRFKNMPPPVVRRFGENIEYQELERKFVNITLDRPKALNALTLDMVRGLDKALAMAEENPSCLFVMLQSAAAPKAFCAGGDVRVISEDPSEMGKSFFAEEYQVNHFIGTYRKPLIAVMDGITMGGGVGLSVHGPFRIATENTVFSMPETKLGLFPDVGGSFFLPRLDGQLGLYLALTSARLKGSDVFMAGIATHYMKAAVVPKIQERLVSVHSVDMDVAHRCIDELSTPCEPFSLSPHLGLIDECFSKDTVEDIIIALENKQADSKFAAETLAAIKKCSPTSLKLTFEQLRRGRELDFASCFMMEYRITQRIVHNSSHDFHEGVRAVLIDKDNKPKWNPAKLEDVSDEHIASYFEPLNPEKGESPELTFVRPISFIDNPTNRYTLPLERSIRNLVHLNADKGLALTLDELVHFASAPLHKAGARQKVADVVARKCTVTPDGHVLWERPSRQPKL